MTRFSMQATDSPRREMKLQTEANDSAIFERAAAEDLIVVSADTDFGTLLASRSASKPSLILFRGQGSRKPDALAALMIATLAQLADALTAGSIVTFEPARLRVRPLPISS